MSPHAKLPHIVMPPNTGRFSYQRNPKIQRALAKLTPDQIIKYLGDDHYLDWLERSIHDEGPSYTATTLREHVTLRERCVYCGTGATDHADGIKCLFMETSFKGELHYWCEALNAWLALAA